MDQPSSVSTALHEQLEQQAVEIQRLRAQAKSIVSYDIAKLEEDKAKLERENAKLEEGIAKLQIRFRDAKMETEKTEKAIAEKKITEKELSNKLSEEMGEARRSLEKEKDETATVRARLDDEEQTLNQRRRKMDLQDEALQKKEASLAIFDQSLRNDRQVIHARQEELTRQERQVRDRQIQLTAAEASFKKQQEILKDLEKKAQDARDESNKAAAVSTDALRKNEKERARIAKEAENAQRFYAMAKGVRNQLIALGGDAKENVTKLLNAGFIAMGLDIPTDDSPIS